MTELTGSIAILGAMEAELNAFIARINQQQTHDVAGIQFTSGLLHGKPVVLARLGVGKVNAAMVTTLVLAQARPTAVICTGVAGSLNPALHPGDIVIAARTAYHDYGRILPDGFVAWPTWNRVTGEVNPTYFPAHDRLLRFAKDASRQVELSPMHLIGGEHRPQVIVGTVVTGDVLVAAAAKRAALRETLDADACEMESTAVAQVCWQQDVPCLAIRSISDRADENVMLDWTDHMQVAADNAAALVTAIVDRAALDRLQT
ncbi:MAG: 5'-methylthioadenosine/adenosylhomocysteine nucleosidase [Anaerolineae bacterium]|nr:5'-methylthioadenosine/adenosylhomocysteine nucleosidase [Anaerolineae bacterium]